MHDKLICRKLWTFPEFHFENSIDLIVLYVYMMNVDIQMFVIIGLPLFDQRLIMLRAVPFEMLRGGGMETIKR